MARHTQAEFAKICGVTNAYISVNKKRGKVIFSEDGYIDDSIQQNAYFLQKCLSKNENNPIEEDIKPEKEPIIEKKSTISEESNKKKKKAGSLIEEKFNLEIEKKQVEIEDIKVRTRLNELKEEKIRGEVIPIAIVKQIVSMLAQALVTAHKDADEYILIQISKEVRLTGEQLAKLRGQMVKALNEGSDKAILMAQRNMKALVDEFSIKKEVGEHE